MTSGGLALVQALRAAWEAAVPLHASQQRALWSAELEGERALHWLETLPPAHAWCQLAATSAVAAAARLGRSEGAAVPEAAAALSG